MRINEQMHMVGHNHPGAEIIELKCGIGMMQRRCHAGRYPIVFQPSRAEQRFV
jgi:hypothetical protein